MIDSAPSHMLEDRWELDALSAWTMRSHPEHCSTSEVCTDAFVCRNGNLHVYSIGSASDPIEQFSRDALRIFIDANNSLTDTIDAVVWLLDLLTAGSNSRPAISICSIDRHALTIAHARSGDVAYSLLSQNGTSFDLAAVSKVNFSSTDRIIMQLRSQRISIVRFEAELSLLRALAKQRF